MVRSDGSNQVTYRGRPLYRFAGDQVAGDTTGQGISDVWWVAAEDGSIVGAEVPLSARADARRHDHGVGTFITGADGMTTYFFTVDSVPGVSQCAGDCLAAWPPVTISTDGGWRQGG